MPNPNLAHHASPGRSAFHQRLQSVTEGVSQGFETIDERLKHDVAELTRHLDAGLQGLTEAVRTQRPPGDPTIVLILRVRIRTLVDVDRWQWIRIDASAPVNEAWALMSKHGIKSLLVIDAQQQCVGLCTRSGLLAAADARKWTAAVDKYMVALPAFVGLDIDATVEQALQAFARHPVGRLILLDAQGVPVGLLTMAGLLRWLGQQLRQAQSAQSVSST